MKLSLLAAAVILRGVFAHAQDVTVTAKDTRPDDSVTQQFMALDQECRNYVSKHDAANAVIACKRVSDEADKYDPKTHPITRRGAYVFYATALIQARKYQDAVKASDKAVAVVLMGFDDGSGSNGAYFVRGQARADAGDLNGADQDLEKAEKFERDALNGSCRAGPAWTIFENFEVGTQCSTLRCLPQWEIRTRRRKNRTKHRSCELPNR